MTANQIFVMFKKSNQTVCNWINLVTMALFFWAWNIKIKRPPHTPMKSGCKLLLNIQAQQETNTSLHDLSVQLSAFLHVTAHITSPHCTAVLCNIPATFRAVRTAEVRVRTPEGCFRKNETTCFWHLYIATSSTTLYYLHYPALTHVYYRYVFTVTSLIHPLITNTF